MFKYIDVKYIPIGYDYSNVRIFSVNITFLAKSINELQQFEREITAETALFISTLSPQVTEINLSGNSLGCIETNNIIEILNATKDSIVSLNLCWNELHQKNGPQLAEFLPLISEHVVSVNLSWNDLYLMDINELHHTFKSIRNNVIVLDLSWNYLGNQSNDFLTVLFWSIPPGVKTLVLTGNNLNTKTPEEFALIFKYLPPGVETVYLDNGQIYQPNPLKTQVYATEEVTVTRTVSRTRSIDGPYGFFSSNEQQIDTETLSQSYYGHMT